MSVGPVRCRLALTLLAVLLLLGLHVTYAHSVSLSGTFDILVARGGTGFLLRVQPGPQRVRLSLDLNVTRPTRSGLQVVATGSSASSNAG